MTDSRKIFVSYSHKDRKLFDEFKTMLAPAVRQGLVDAWDDQRIAAGAQWKDEIDGAIRSAGVAVLLVSQNFLASHFIAQEELPPLLQAAREGGVSIFWVHLSASLYKTTEIATYQAAHDVSRPLDTLSKPQRQAVLSQICSKLIATAKQGSATAEARPEARAAADRCMECCVLVLEALKNADWAALGGGPSTTLHRRAELAQRWLDEAKRLLPECSGRLEAELAGLLNHAANRAIPGILGWARSRMPEAGASSDREWRDSDAFSEAKHDAYTTLRGLEEGLKGNAGFAAFERSGQRWAVLGFKDDAELQDYLYPSLKRVALNPDPMLRDMFERLHAQPEFSPKQLHEEGYRKDVVMDGLNGLLREKWAEWTDLTVIGDGSKGRMTEVGRRLLRQMLDQK